MPTLIHQRVRACQAGVNPAVVCKMKSGWVVIGDNQIVSGYSLLLPDPVVKDLNSLAEPARIQYLSDMVRIGDALLQLTDALRINYEILGNSEPALHAHVIPRYISEPELLRLGPIWAYDWASAPPTDIAKCKDFMNQLAEILTGD